MAAKPIKITPVYRLAQVKWSEDSLLSIAQEVMGQVRAFRQATQGIEYEEFAEDYFDELLENLKKAVMVIVGVDSMTPSLKRRVDRACLLAWRESFPPELMGVFNDDEPEREENELWGVVGVPF